jgi:hypothetical protein
MNKFAVRHMTKILLLVALCGCSSQPPTGKVLGEVTLDGQPVKDGAVMFFPADGQGQTGGAAIKEGKFVAEQVPVSKMKVEIHGNKVVGKYKAYDTPDSPLIDQIVEIVPPRYNFQSELILDVKKGEQQVRYDLKSK